MVDSLTTTTPIITPTSKPRPNKTIAPIYITIVVSLTEMVGVCLRKIPTILAILPMLFIEIIQRNIAISSKKGSA